MAGKKTGHIRDAPGFRAAFRRGFYFLLVLLLAIDLAAWYLAGRQGHFAWETVPFFNAVYGFIACVALIFIAKGLRFLVRRGEDFYD